MTNKTTSRPSEGESTSKDLQPSQPESKEKDVSAPPPLPPLDTLDTKTPVLFNQQVNIQQIPPSAWDMLSSEQVVDLSKQIISTANIIDERHFKYAMDRAEKRSMKDKLSHWIGGIITCVGMGAATYLAMNGHELVSATISLPLATILAVIVGRRFI